MLDFPILFFLNKHFLVHWMFNAHMHFKETKCLYISDFIKRQLISGAVVIKFICSFQSLIAFIEVTLNARRSGAIPWNIDGSVLFGISLEIVLLVIFMG